MPLLIPPWMPPERLAVVVMRRGWRPSRAGPGVGIIARSPVSAAAPPKPEPTSTPLQGGEAGVRPGPGGHQACRILGSPSPGGKRRCADAHPAAERVARFLGGEDRVSIAVAPVARMRTAGGMGIDQRARGRGGERAVGDWRAVCIGVPTQATMARPGKRAASSCSAPRPPPPDRRSRARGSAPAALPGAQPELGVVAEVGVAGAVDIVASRR